MISAEVIELSVIITDYLQSHRLRNTLTWKINYAARWYSCVQTTHCLTLIIKSGSYEILKVPVNVHVPINRFVNSFTVQNELRIAFSLCHSSADHKQVAFSVCI